MPNGKPGSLHWTPQETQPVLDQIEYVDHLIQTDLKRKLQNPPGLFVWAIESNLGVPHAFETSQRRAARERANEAVLEAERRQYGLRAEYDQFTQVEVDRMITEQYPGSKWDEAIRVKLKAMRKEQPELFSRLPEATQREMVAESIRAGLRETAVPSFEVWTGRDRQMPLFRA